MPAALVERLRAAGIADHSAAVARLAAATCRTLRLSRPASRWVAIAALLHDVGKFDLPPRVLRHHGPLSDAEWEVVREHPALGERALLGFAELRPLARVIRATHERWDGSGYPDGLAGDEIPFAARVVTACDTFDAIVSERPYRPSRSRATAMTTLREGAGTQFDPAVVRAVLDTVVARPAPPR